MKISEIVERLGRTVFEAPFGALSQTLGDSPEVAEIRIAVLDEVRKKVQRAGGKSLFPYNVVRIVIRAEGQEAAIFERDFFRGFFHEEVTRALAKDACRYPDDLRVEVALSEPAGNEKWLTVETYASEPERDAVPVKRIGKLVVVAGDPNRSEILLHKPRTNIGRVVDVYKSEGLSRRNDLAFAAETEINRTVSREHAHIVYDPKTGEYRLFNDRFTKGGLSLVRDGMGQEVHRDARGTKLVPGDEIHLGKAILRFRS